MFGVNCGTYFPALFRLGHRPVGVVVKGGGWGIRRRDQRPFWGVPSILGNALHCLQALQQAFEVL